MGESWEKDLPEHQRRTFEEIKRLNQQSEEMAKGGKRPKEPPQVPSPRSKFRQKRHEIVSEEDI